MDTADPRQIRRRGFVAGVLAGVAMVAAMLLMNSLLGLPTLPDLFADPLLFLIPGAVFGVLIDALQFTAKTLLLAGLLEGQLLVCGWVGRVWAGRAKEGAELRTALVVVAVVYAAFEAVLLPLLGQGFLGLLLPTGPVVGAVGYGLLHLVYALVLVALYRADWSFDAERRRVLATIGAASLAVVGGGTLWRASSGSTVVGADSGAATGDLSEDVTPLDRFYTVSKNFSDPHVDANTWQLRVDGLVEQPLTLTYDGLRSLPSVDQYFTLACISNLVGGDLIGNGQWKGVRLRDLLQKAGVKPGVRKVVFYASDGYTDSILLAKALEERTVVAYEMDGAPLTYKHGAPARLLIPGIYGMKNCKWVTRIELVDHEYRGYWQQQGWSDAAPIQTMSRIDVPVGGRTLSGPVQIGGIAHAGDRGVARVEVSVDGGKTWQEAARRPPLSRDSWTIWTFDWTPPGAGSYQLKVRATDGLGRTQVDQFTDSFPDGATGYHSVTVRVI